MLDFYFLESSVASFEYDAFNLALDKIFRSEYTSCLLAHDNIPMPKSTYIKLLNLFDDEKSSNKSIIQTLQTNPILY